MREQTAREQLELNLLTALAQTCLDQPLRAARVLVKSSLMPEHFSDAVARDTFQELRVAILAHDTSGELLNALHLLADSTNAQNVQGNLEELIEELVALGTVINPNVPEMQETDLAGHTAVLFCRSCGSSICDVNNWSDKTLRTAVIKCYECGCEGRLTGFSVGRIRCTSIPPATLAQALAEARKDAPNLNWRREIAVE